MLADRGFLVAEQQVALTGAELITPAFRGKRQQLRQFEVENSVIHAGSLTSELRIHVERVKGNLKIMFYILGGVVPFIELRKDGDGYDLIDKIAFVCCCLHNAQSSVVPFN